MSKLAEATLEPEIAPAVPSAEAVRLEESRRRAKHWKRWGPYLSERAWGTVREDYSPDGDAWDYFPHDHARSRAYRWNEDGLAGICDRHQRICFALALWNGRDPILKERLFGLTGSEGNHGEDVKEYYFYLDSTPTHSYMKCLYKYPQADVPLRDARRREPPPRQARARSTSCSTPASSTTTATSTCRRVRQGRRRRHPDPHHGRQPRAGGGAAAPAADALVPQHLVLERRGRRGRAVCAPRPTPDVVDRARRADGTAAAGCTATALAPSCCSPRTRPTRGGCSATPNGPAYVKDGINDYVVDGDADAVNPRATGPRPRRTTCSTCPPAGRCRCGCASPIAPPGAGGDVVRRGVRRDLRAARSRRPTILRDVILPSTCPTTRGA